MLRPNYLLVFRNVVKFSNMYRVYFLSSAENAKSPTNAKQSTCKLYFFGPVTAIVLFNEISLSEKLHRTRQVNVIAEETSPLQKDYTNYYINNHACKPTTRHTCAYVYIHVYMNIFVRFPTFLENKRFTETFSPGKLSSIIYTC